MFWGMTLEPGKLYTETMGEEVQLSMAAIDSRKDLGESTSNFCQIVIQTDKGEYVLCTLVHGVMFQQSLDLKLMPREKVTFSVQGPSVVYLVGYTASYPEDEGLDMEDEEDFEAGDEDSSAWEPFDAEEELFVEKIKEEPVEIINDSNDSQELLASEDEEYREDEGEVAPQQPPQQEAEMAENTQDEREEEIIFSVAELENNDLKTEAPTPKQEGSPSSSQVMPPPQLTAQEDLYDVQTTNQGTALPISSPNSEFFYPETQQQPDVPITPPVTFQSSNTATDYQQQSPQAVLPPAQTFVNPQKTFMQRPHQSPQRHPSHMGRGQPMNTQRTYPLPRRQYGTNRNQPVSKSRSLPQQINVQQVRNVSNIQSMPGTSQQDIPGPSTSGPISRGNSIGQGKAPSALPRQEQQKRPSGESSSYSVIYQCKICGKNIADFAKFKAHESYHQRAGRYKCQFCSKTFHSKADTRRHERTHTGEKPYKCSVCGRGFAQITNRNMHEHIHYR